LSPDALYLPGRPRSVVVRNETPEVYLATRIAELERNTLELGRRAGREAALAEFAELFASLADDAIAAGERAAAGLASQTALLVTAVASQVLRKELEAGRYDIERMVRETLAVAATGRAPCTVRVHPDDAEHLASVRFRSGTTVVADAELRQGSVHVESSHGLVVREIDIILRQLRATLEARAT